MIHAAETAVRALGAAVFVASLVLSAMAAGRGAARERGRASGLAARIGAISTYLLGAGPFAAIGVLLWSPIPVTPPVAARAALLVAGVALGLAGALVYAWGRITLGDMYNVSSSLGSELYARHRLVTEGPYHYVRHPMYAGVVVGSLGALLVYRTWTTVFVIATLPGVLVKARREERLLAQEFGSVYAAYHARVPGWIPRLAREAASRRENGREGANP